MLPRHSPQFHKNTTSNTPRNLSKAAASGQCSKGVSDSANVTEDFRPLLWQGSIPELSGNEIRFPILSQPAPSTASCNQLPKSAYSNDVIAPGRGSQTPIGANWNVILRR